ncbi:F-box only protein 16 isoform X6 [Acipenser ruthenus]|uniref:F-box only protein 16 isoform X6 n=1 Tax=Acipenser ruthenus TaxID=7906 RepID=UPI00145BFF89|nr:F-box only protein 16 isoform X6 [Acipenser ruthenus]
MAFAPRTTNGSKMQTKMSTWTPLNHQQSNDQVFDERKNLLGKWFDKWTDSQRKQILLDLFGRCSTAQLRFVCRNLQNRVPEVALDFTTVLPRVLALYIFSFLDPRSLCRCAQVSWHWRYLIELDQLWMPKCLRFGWWINFSPTPFEQGVWKRHYIEMVRELHVTRPKTPQKTEFIVPEVEPIRKDVLDLTLSHSSLSQLVPLSRRGTFGKASRMPGKGLPPWKSSDKHPTDTLRFNYLDNFDPLEQAHQGRNKGEGINPDLSKMEHERKKPPSTITYKLRKAKSLEEEESPCQTIGRLKSDGKALDSCFPPRNLASGRPVSVMWLTSFALGTRKPPLASHRKILNMLKLCELTEIDRLIL